MSRILITALMIVVGSVSCSKPEEITPPEYTYTIRGILVSTSKDADGKSIARIRHEPIPEFFDAEGHAEPMRAMTMPFPLADSIDLAPFKVGDEVQGIYEVRWKGKPREIISKLELLPPGTVNLPAKK